MLKAGHKTASPPVLQVVDPAKGHGTLVGLWGHTIEKDGAINWQFTIEKEIRFGRYLIRLYSWWDGEPTEVKVFSEYKLLGKGCKLYLTREDWTRAAEKNNERQRQVRLTAKGFVDAP